MSKNKWSAVLFLSSFFVCFAALRAGNAASPKAESALDLDVPVRSERANVVFDSGHLVMVCDMPFAAGALGWTLRRRRGDTQGVVIRSHAQGRGRLAYRRYKDESTYTVSPVLQSKKHP
jgi:hypothetical protein